MSWTATPRLLGYTWLVAALLVASLAGGRPGLAVAAAPLGAVLLFGLLVSRRPRLTPPTVALTERRVIEGDVVGVDVNVVLPTELESLEVGLIVPRGAELVETPNPGILRLQDGRRQTLRFQVRPLRWGVHDLGTVRIRGFDDLRLWRVQARYAAGSEAALRALPRSERLRTLTRPARTRTLAGSRLAAQSGDGMEFADVRLHAPGDRLRSINWRATARRGELWVNRRHLERNVDTVLLLDTFTHAGPAGEGTLERMIRAAWSLASAWLRERDRVGVIGFGGVLRWLEPGGGMRHAYRLADALLDTEVVLSYAWKGLDIIPTRLLPPSALIVGVTPLLDPRVVATLLDLRGRGFDLVVIEVAVDGHLRPPVSELQTMARRLWLLEREALRERFVQAGIGLGSWGRDEALEPVLGEVERWRRRARLRTL